MLSVAGLGIARRKLRMSSFKIIDPVFGTYVLGNAPMKKLATGFDWVEGPVWFGD
jgi:gluconolactonase